MARMTYNEPSKPKEYKPIKTQKAYTGQADHKKLMNSGAGIAKEARPILNATKQQTSTTNPPTAKPLGPAINFYKPNC